MTKSAFNELPWHDATIECLVVDRTSPGERDELAVTVKWPEGTRGIVRFTDCYAVDARLNFGVIAPESVLEAEEVETSALLESTRAKWAHLADVSQFRCFRIETNSTASTIWICALGWRLEPL